MIHPNSPSFDATVLQHLRSLPREDIRVSSVENSHSRASKELTAGSAQLNLREKSVYVPSKVDDDFFAGFAFPDKCLIARQL